MVEKLLRIIEKIIPAKLFTWLQPVYHFKLALLGAILYGFPSREVKVVAVTGTKGKSTTTEILNAILEEAGYKTAVSNTVRFKINKESRSNLFKMSMPGRFFMQRFLRQAASAGCDYAIIEATSQGAQFYRHKFIAFDALIVTNISPEHIESHGSYEKYKAAKFSIGQALESSSKSDKILVVNADEIELKQFYNLKVDQQIMYSIAQAGAYELGSEGSQFTIEGETITLNLPGLFNIYNALAAIAYARTQNIGLAIIRTALQKFRGVRGRVEKVAISPKQQFEVIVDYAHTADSLEKLYQAFPATRKICVLGNTGGGRDKWKRPEMAKIADKYCDEVILTNEDPYDEDPRVIVDEMAKAVSPSKLKIVMDRRDAIRSAVTSAESGDVVLISGKGTDPFIMGPNGSKIPWDDATVVREELGKIFTS